MLCLLLLAGCNTIPTQPKIVEVPVERYRPLPDWATTERPVPQAKDGRVISRLANEHERGLENELSNCHRRLLKQLDNNQAVDPRSCDPEK
jgi:hypothetical protein